MNRVIKERVALGTFMAVTVGLCLSASWLNTNSFNKDASEVMFAVRTSVGNLRSGPSKSYDVIKQLDKGGILRPTAIRGSWVKGMVGRTEGWMHESILSKYVHLKYYNEYTEGVSTFEIKWGR